LVFLITTWGVSTIPVAASGPTPLAIHTNNMVVGGQFAPGTSGTELDIMLNGGAALPGWCVTEAVDIYVNTQYSADIYSYLDYFGTSFPNNVGLLPSAIITNTSTKTPVNWPAIAYILNNPIAGAPWQDIQQAIWYFSDGDSNGLVSGNNNGHTVDSNAQAYVDAANTYLNAHNNTYIPATGQLEPEICYVPGDTAYQVIFYTQKVTTLPDLVVTSITATADPSDPTWYSVSFTVKNQGDADAEATDTSLIVNGGEIANPDCPALVAGASADVVVPADQLGQITGKQDIISITVNPSYGVAESEYSNDSASTTYSLFSISASAGANGTVSPAGDISVGKGTNKSFTITPNTHYHVISLTVDNNPVSIATIYTFNNIQANHTISAAFAVNTFNLNYSAGANGSISGSSSQAVSYGGSGTAVTAIPADGYHFVNWSDNSTANPRRDSNITANISVTANFAATIFSVNYNAAANGSISGSSSRLSITAVAAPQ